MVQAGTPGSGAGLREEVRRIGEDRDWTALEAWCDQFWPVLDTPAVKEVLVVLRSVPERELLARPRLMMFVAVAYYAAFSSDDVELRPFVEQYLDSATRVASTMDVAREDSATTLVVSGSAALVSLRYRGQFAESVAFGERLEARLARLRSGPRGGWLPLQQGITHSLTGDFERAAGEYRQAHQQASLLQVPAAATLRAAAAANLAMISAHTGNGATAREWLGELRSIPLPAGWISHLVGMAGAVAEGWEALDRYDSMTLEEILEITGDGTAPVEIWPFINPLASAHGLLWGDPAASLAHLDTVRFDHARLLTAQGTARWVLRRARLDLLIATGRANRALRYLGETGQRVRWLAVPAARLRLLSGKYAAARTLAADGDSAAPRDRLQLLLIGAVAAARLGLRVEAVARAREAMRERSSDEVLSLALLSEEHRDEIFRLTDVPLTDMAAERLAGVRPVFPERVELVELTNREQAVLGKLDGDGTVADIARELVVSASTVRTQVQSLYRKLGVSTRQEAVLRAYELGLL
ncbi:LuxR C-terminal-related transcriptional regulator [Amycolatopsis sp. GM8]|uniref:helix-turn-helix transcriptional regulator n=1 Tax=Amycolatopsis sp. GM8 TaxID=2896530 RepID=UPI001F023710|nr:LuxR C-terminal-related transcriptional regulator [Amycolatopsis sp. GM8]